MNEAVATASKQVVERYFDMWNTGDVSAASAILSQDWVDHAHPEVAGPAAVERAIKQIKAAQPALHFHIERILADADRIAAIGSVRQGQDLSTPGTGMIWLVRMADGQMAEMWTYRSTT
ncbi:ester cyclase [Nonomuraea guangzhouensis]|uniref:Ester cyclase n=1 Tax=Nonomuraea guangzhouensis TaxID=1291555 RepID=A0ABW4GN05_9ACTN|nr:nuclear transport factor 2 family protein [Nonomuraea guangzhouensis]